MDGKARLVLPKRRGVPGRPASRVEPDANGQERRRRQLLRLFVRTTAERRPGHHAQRSFEGHVRHVQVAALRQRPVRAPRRLRGVRSAHGAPGFPLPTTLGLPGGADGFLRALAVPRIDVDRLPDLWYVDLRLAKVVRFGEDATLSLSLDLFNALNASTVLARSQTATNDVFGRVEEILNPRVLRLGARFRF